MAVVVFVLVFAFVFGFAVVVVVVVAVVAVVVNIVTVAVVLIIIVIVIIIIITVCLFVLVGDGQEKLVARGRDPRHEHGGVVWVVQANSGRDPHIDGNQHLDIGFQLVRARLALALARDCRAAERGDDAEGTDVPPGPPRSKGDLYLYLAAWRYPLVACICCFVLCCVVLFVFVLFLFVLSRSDGKGVM